ncbi:MAG TPA: O-antigen ligase family protein [Solirubrobacteraceae bacterium]|nr:O-antigen ligase family protein [Solirubrobacteraceae bacterium]
MGGLPRPATGVPRLPPVAVSGLALVVAVAAGHYFADGRTTLAAGLVLAVWYGPLVLLDLTMAVAVYVVVLYVGDITALSVGPNTMGLLLLLAWIGTLLTHTAHRLVLREHARLLLFLALFVLWLALSMTWAANSGEARNGLQNWTIAIAAFLVVLTAPQSPRDVAKIALAFVIGGVTSVAFGIATGELSAAATSAGELGRFTGGGGDANVQAAGFLAAMFLCPGLWPLVRSKLGRASLLLAFTLVTIGFFATQSRGGFISLAVAAAAGFVLLPPQRKRLLGLAGAAALGLGVFAALNPGGVARITDFSGGTSGRNDLWTVAWKIFTEHPWVGIGASNFQLVEPHYALLSGTLARVDLITEDPHLVHNVYLQLLTETGVIGLLVFLFVIGSCIRASWLAARRFDAVGQVGYGDLARAILMAEIAMLSAQFFISDGEDLRLWFLLGLGPALLSFANRAQHADYPGAARASPMVEGQPRFAARRLS